MATKKKITWADVCRESEAELDKMILRANVTQYLASIGRKGGIVKSKAKAAAARANGKRGGRPKGPRS